MAPLVNIPSRVSPNGDLDRLKAMKVDTPEAEKARLRKVTQEFESFFTYYMLKTMRQTIPKEDSGSESMLGSDLGKDMFTDMFDMEVGRKMSQGQSRSLSDMLYKSLEKLIDQRATPEAGTVKAIPLKKVESRQLPLKAEPISLPEPERPAQVKAVKAKPIDLPSATRNVHPDKVISTYGKLIDEAAERHQVDSALIASVIHAESSGNPNAVSDAGAKGLMQLTDSTAEYLGVQDSLDPKENIMGGAKYLRKLMDKYGDIRLALAAYNAGPGNVDKYGGVPPFKETTDYIAKVTGFLKNLSSKHDQSAKGE